VTGLCQLPAKPPAAILRVCLATMQGKCTAQHTNTNTNGSCSCCSATARTNLAAAVAAAVGLLLLPMVLLGSSGAAVGLLLLLLLLPVVAWGCCQWCCWAAVGLLWANWLPVLASPWPEHPAGWLGQLLHTHKQVDRTVGLWVYSTTRGVWVLLKNPSLFVPPFSAVVWKKDGWHIRLHC
jgi:hypothetical protein